MTTIHTIAGFWGLGVFPTSPSTLFFFVLLYKSIPSHTTGSTATEKLTGSYLTITTLLRK